jgi:hypothetical protein
MGKRGSIKADDSYNVKLDMRPDTLVIIRQDDVRVNLSFRIITVIPVIKIRM